MTLAGLAPGVVRPAALVLNVIVACIGFWQFRSAGHFSWSLYWPFALLAVPAAFVGGTMKPPAHVLPPVAVVRRILAGVLLAGALKLLLL